MYEICDFSLFTINLEVGLLFSHLKVQKQILQTTGNWNKDLVNQDEISLFMLHAFREPTVKSISIDCRQDTE